MEALLIRGVVMMLVGFGLGYSLRWVPVRRFGMWMTIILFSLLAYHAWCLIYNLT